MCVQCNSVRSEKHRTVKLDGLPPPSSHRDENLSWKSWTGVRLYENSSTPTLVENFE